MIHLMALLALRGEAKCNVVWCLGVEILLLVAGLAGGAGKGKIILRHALMAALAIHKKMPAHQGEVGLGMDFFSIEFLPAHGGVATGAILAQFGLVHVLVTGQALLLCSAEIFYVVAGSTGKIRMLSHQVELGFAVIETNVPETAGNMAGITGQGEHFMRAHLR